MVGHSSDIYTCSFCGRTGVDLVEGTDAYICDECAAAAVEKIAARKAAAGRAEVSAGAETSEKSCAADLLAKSQTNN